MAECAARDENLEFQRLVGRRSAMRALPLEPLIAAYQIGFRELWSILAQRSSLRLLPVLRRGERADAGRVAE